MMYKIQMVKGALMKRFNKRTKLKGGLSFLVQLDSETANRYRKEAKTKGIDANMYLAQVLTNNK